MKWGRVWGCVWCPPCGPKGNTFILSDCTNHVQVSASMRQLKHVVDPRDEDVWPADKNRWNDPAYQAKNNALERARSKKNREAGLTRDGKEGKRTPKRNSYRYVFEQFRNLVRSTAVDIPAAASWFPRVAVRDHAIKNAR